MKNIFSIDYLVNKSILDKPIGVFDSGLGGLTVVKQIMNNLPHENVIYFGDIARLPYGTKSVEAIQKFTKQTVNFLIQQNVKAIVIACNTIAANAKEVILEIAAKHNLPVIDVLFSGAKSAFQASNNNKVGVVATPATVRSQAYTTLLYNLNPNLQVFSQACALLVPFIEEGLLTHPALKLITQDYLAPLIQENIDTLILGCTHYPLIQPLIKDIVGNIKIIDPAFQAVFELDEILTSHELKVSKVTTPIYKFFVTDLPQSFRSTAELFLNTTINNIELVNLED